VRDRGSTPVGAIGVTLWHAVQNAVVIQLITQRVPGAVSPGKKRSECEAEHFYLQTIPLFSWHILN
jgi:hypothetical protein